MGGHIIVSNETDHTWTICIHLMRYKSGYKIKVEPRNEKTARYYIIYGWASFNSRSGNCTKQQCCNEPELCCEFALRGDSKFTIRESRDRQQIHLDCSTPHNPRISTCTNYVPH